MSIKSPYTKETRAMRRGPPKSKRRATKEFGNGKWPVRKDAQRNGHRPDITKPGAPCRHCPTLAEDFLFTKCRKPRP